jgi:predicted XRE-type DNA-binding protein
MNTETEIIEFTPSSGNVFLDLDLPDPETKLLKVKIFAQITKLIKTQNIPLEKLALKLNLSAQELKNIREEKLSNLSLETLLRCLNILGQIVEIEPSDPLVQPLAVSRLG